MRAGSPPKQSSESGIALPVAMMLVLLLGVMGAGLLTFVSTDLNAVVETNQGQRAFESADAGVRAAKQQLERKSSPSNYNGGSDDVQWSKDRPNSDAECSGLLGAGVCIAGLDDSSTDNAVNVTIESVSSGTYRVISVGRHGEAVRKIEAIYRARNFSIPMAYFTANSLNDSIDIRSTAVIENMSLFTQGSITMQSGAQFVGEDLLYGNWAKPGSPNTTPRPTTIPGIGAVCYIALDSRKNCDGSGPSLGGSSSQLSLGTRNFDITGGGGSGSRYSGARFVNSVASPQPASRITFPFDSSTMDYEPDAEGLDPRMTYLKQLAIEQGNFICEDASDPECVDKPAVLDNNRIGGWPANSDYDTVVYIKRNHSSGGLSTLEWRVPGSCTATDAKRGVLIVDGYFLRVKGSTAPFSGVTLAHGGRIDNDQDTFESESGSCWEGPVSSRGETTIGGRAGFFLTGTTPSDVSNLGGAELQSWRELYE